MTKRLAVVAYGAIAYVACLATFGYTIGLRNQLGEAYERYAEEVPRFIPHVGRAMAPSPRLCAH
jgi:protein-S-isoprenylcysteine O-methyltransferase Ste14